MPGFDPVGQEFTPAAEWLDIVELRINSQESSVSGDVFLRIRLNGQGGAVLGTSETVTIPGTNVPIRAHFDFRAPVALDPGTKYFIEVIALGTELGVFLSGSGSDPYPGGTAIFRGAARPLDDLWFREGYSELVAVERTTWSQVRNLYRSQGRAP